jgi:peroxiredoxin
MDTGKRKNSIITSWPVYLVIVVLVGVLLWAFKDKASNSLSGHVHVSEELSAKLDPSGAALRNVQGSGKKTLLDVVKYRRTWNPGWTEWYGKNAPELAFQDIEGKMHKLSDYKGSNIILVFWATWCAPCHIEIPHLMDLRKKYGKDELQIVGISSENQITVKRFAENQKLNYTVGTLVERPPEPYVSVRSIPSAFYIDKQGKIKLASEGVVSKAELEAIVLAEN